MNIDEVMNKLQTVFRDVFMDGELEISRETTADDIELWDSLAHIQLINTIEQVFGIKFGMKEMMRLNNVADLVDTIMSKVDAG